MINRQLSLSKSKINFSYNLMNKINNLNWWFHNKKLKNNKYQKNNKPIYKKINKLYKNNKYNRI